MNKKARDRMLYYPLIELREEVEQIEKILIQKKMPAHECKEISREIVARSFHPHWTWDDVLSAHRQHQQRSNQLVVENGHLSAPPRTHIYGTEPVECFSKSRPLLEQQRDLERRRENIKAALTALSIDCTNDIMKALPSKPLVKRPLAPVSGDVFSTYWLAAAPLAKELLTQGGLAFVSSQEADKILALRQQQKKPITYTQFQLSSSETGNVMSLFPTAKHVSSYRHFMEGVLFRHERLRNGQEKKQFFRSIEKLIVTAITKQLISDTMPLHEVLSYTRLMSLAQDPVIPKEIQKESLLFLNKLNNGRLFIERNNECKDDRVLLKSEWQLLKHISQTSSKEQVAPKDLRCSLFTPGLVLVIHDENKSQQRSYNCAMSLFEKGIMAAFMNELASSEMSGEPRMLWLGYGLKGFASPASELEMSRLFRARWSLTYWSSKQTQIMKMLERQA